MRNVFRFFSIVLCLGLASPQAMAQPRLGEIGFTMQGRQGMSGSPCSGADCVPRPATVMRGETVSLRVQAPFGSPFAIGFAPNASRCVRLPFVSNWLVLGDPVRTLTVGRVVSPDFQCYFAMGVHNLTIPNRLPPGMQFALQSWAQVPTTNGLMPSWSVGILATVQ